jgi:hypothetical protein
VVERGDLFEETAAAKSLSNRERSKAIVGESNICLVLLHHSLLSGF